MKKLTDKISSQEFLTPLKEFPELVSKKAQTENNIKNLCFQLLKSDLSVNDFYKIIGDLIFSEARLLRMVCRLILYWQMMLMNEKFDVKGVLGQIESDIFEEKTTELTLVFLNFVETSLYFYKNSKEVVKYLNEEYPKDIIYFVAGNQIMHYTRLPLPKTIYEDIFMEMLIEDDLALKNYNYSEEFEERKNDQNFPNKKNNQYMNSNAIGKPPKENPLSKVIITMGKLIEKYSSEIDFDSKKSLEGTGTLYGDFEKALQGLPKDQEEVRSVQKYMDDLIENIEKAKTHTCYQPSPKDFCDICKTAQNFYFQIECMRNSDLKSLPVFCKTCFKLLLKSKFFSELPMPYLTLECFDKEKCNKRMIFTEKSLQKFIEDNKELTDFLKDYNTLRDKFGKCFSCKNKWASSETQDDKMSMVCQKCNRETCKVCWNESHPAKLCNHLIKEYNTAPLHNLVGEIIVCPICYSISRKISQGENIIKCENCHRTLCEFCFQSMDSISYHGAFLHDSNCQFYSYKKVRTTEEEECQICNIRGRDTPCKQFSYRKFIGF